VSPVAVAAPVMPLPAPRLVRALARIADAVASGADLERATHLIGAAIAEVFRPMRHALLPAEAAAGAAPWAARPGAPLGRDALDDPALHALRDRCRAAMAGLGVELLAPLGAGDRPVGILVLGPRRGSRPYTARDVQALRLLARHGALALEQVRTRDRLEVALRRVEVLEGIRTSLAKFVPATVRTLIERDPARPALARRDADVSVLFVDIVGYTRLAERLGPERAARLVERCFGAFLDEVITRGGDVNETSGDSLMIIFDGPDPRSHARAAVGAALEILRRVPGITSGSGDAAEPVALHLGLNSGRATLGVTRIEGVAGVRWTYTAAGPLTNMAARLAELGAGDAVIVGPETRARLAGEFPFEAMGEVRLRNVERPVPVWRLAVPARSARERAGCG